MSDPVIVSAARTAIGTAFKGSLVNTTGEELAEVVLRETVRRSGLDPARIDDVIFAESMYGGGDLARYAAVVLGMTSVPGQAVNRHCAGSLTAIGNGSAGIISGMEKIVVAGGVQATSTGPKLTRRVLGTADQFEDWIPATHPDSPEAPNMDMSISVGWNTAKEAGLTREELDAWAFRSHQRAVAAIDEGRFVDEIVPIKVQAPDGSFREFAVDEHPRRSSTLEKLASLKVLHPEIPGFNITAGNSSGVNDAAAAVTLVGADIAAAEGLPTLAKVRAWAAAGVEPRRMGFGALESISKVLGRAGLTTQDVALWEINEAFASVPVAAVKEFGLDEDTVNISGSGCSLGHPVAASGARMIITLLHDLRRRGGGIGVAAMCAGGGQGGAVLIEV
ncbi:thiolase family protein [Frankia sp. AiPs1]|uniref:thiolase family protein n=1 Tax=Frankia sp. AiPs1 TaxID=573493 RepID=UPI002044856F|nr:thiolase family protein [Frankia sp. AiPs1]MCM3923544.1 thiolase family protein [Frankia sp. AiPs1]